MIRVWGDLSRICWEVVGFQGRENGRRGCVLPRSDGCDSADEAVELRLVVQADSFGKAGELVEEEIRFGRRGVANIAAGLACSLDLRGHQTSMLLNKVIIGVVEESRVGDVGEGQCDVFWDATDEQ